MASSLESLLAEGVISEIYGRLKSGKEAEVYAVAYGDDVVAAKVYKDRAQRSFKSNAAYKEGRAVRNTRSQRAMERGSKFGQEAAEEAWKAEEANALYKLHAAGVRVPKPVMFFDGVLFMELVRGVDGEAAPRLIDTPLDAAQAHAAYLDMLAQLVRILSCDLIHGDLSPYNVLWAEAGATIIDFPQIVSAAQNSQSESFFIRDARNILGHFAAIDPSLRGRLNSDPREIWRAYVRRDLTPDFMPSGRPFVPEQRPRFFDQAPRDRDERRPQTQGDSRAQRGPSPERGPQQNRGSFADRGPRQDRGAQQGRGPQNHGPQANSRGPRDQGPQDNNRGPRDQQGPQQNRGPRQDRGPYQDRGPQQNRGPRDDRGHQDNRSPQQNRGPQLHMASARANANAASQAREQQPRRPQRAQRRGPEVIVLARRAPDATAGAERIEREQLPAASSPNAEAPRDAARRRRR